MSGQSSPAQLAVTAAALAGDSGGLYRIVADLLDDGTPFESVLFDLLLPSARDVGTRWQEGDYLVSEEHAATATMETVVALLAGSFDQPEEAPVVVIAAAPGDQHSLPARAIAAHLVAAGHRTAFLGANVLASDLETYLMDEQPAALVLSCVMSIHLTGARSAVQAAHAAGVPVIVGGRAFGNDDGRARAIGADAWAPTPASVLEILNAWEPVPAEAEAGARTSSPELARLTRTRAEIIGSAHALLEAALGLEDDGRLGDELSLLLGAVESALLLDDDRLIRDMLEWQAVTLSAHGYALGDSLVDALGAALEPSAPTARSLLLAAANKAAG